MKRHVSVFAVVLLCLNLLLSMANASDSDAVRIDYEDGSYAIITTECAGLTRAVTADTKTYTHYNLLGQRCFAYTLYATFSYNGTSSSANTVDFGATIYLSGWGLSSHNEYVVGNGAYGNASFSGPSGAQRDVSLSLVCDKNGNVT